LSHAPARRQALLRMAQLATTSTLLGGCQSAPPTFTAGDTQVALAWLQQWLRERMAAHGEAPLSLAVLQGERVLWATAHGQAQAGVAATPHTRYRAGSISKVYTALGALKLQAQGRLDLDAPLGTLLPGWHMACPSAGPAGCTLADAEPVTPRLILSHHSGLPTDLLEGMWTDTPAALDSVVAATTGQPLAHVPGQVYAYSNLGFSLLGAAMARVVGEPFEAWMQREVLQPLGMADAEWASAAPSGATAGLARDRQGRITHEEGLRDTPAGGLNASVIDLLQLGRLWWDQGQLGGRTLWPAAALLAMQTPAFPPREIDTARVGLGWHLIDDEFDGIGTVLWHAGGTLHHHAELAVVPQLQLAVAVMTSADGAGQLAHDAAVEAVRRLAQARTGRDPKRPPAQGVDAAHPPVPLAQLAGVFDTPLGLVHIGDDGVVSPVGDDGDGPRLRLSRRDDGYAQLQYRLLGLLPVGLGDLGDMAFTRGAILPDAQGLLVRRQGRFMYGGLALSPTPLSPAWQARLGRWRYVGADAAVARLMPSARLRALHGLLVLDLGDRLRVALQPLDDHRAVVRGLGRSRGDTVRITTGTGSAAGNAGGSEVLHCAGLPWVRVS